MKNVNKQQKSADFFSEMLKFQKSALTKILLKNFFEILTSQKKSQLISAVCLHFFKKYINSKLFMVQYENGITV